MLRLYLRDSESGVTAECPNRQHGVIGGPYKEWNMKDALTALTQKLAETKGKAPHEILFESPPFDIVAVWEP